MSHIVKQITESISVNRVRSGVVSINATAITGETDDYISTTIIVTDDVARALAAGLVELAGADAETEAVES